MKSQLIEKKKNEIDRNLKREKNTHTPCLPICENAAAAALELATTTATTAANKTIY